MTVEHIRLSRSDCRIAAEGEGIRRGVDTCWGGGFCEGVYPAFPVPVCRNSGVFL